MRVALMDVQGPWRQLLPRVREAVIGVIDSGAYILGPQVAAFEAEAADALGVDHAVGVANGTDAIVIALRACGVSAGDEVLCPSFTFYASAEAISAVGAVPVFCDIDPDTFTLDPGACRAAITPRTTAIMAVHLFGHIADTRALRHLCDQHQLVLIEDAAQAFGAAGVGRHGDVSTYSFYPTKNLGAMGDGGLIATSRSDIAERCRLLRFHGSVDKRTFVEVGYNSRLDEVQAAVLRVFLPAVASWNADRAAAADRYLDLGLGEHVTLPPRGGVYHLYVVRSPERQRLLHSLSDAGVEARVYYDPPLHRQPVYRNLPHGELPGTLTAAAEAFALPISPVISADAQRLVVDAIRSVPASV